MWALGLQSAKSYCKSKRGNANLFELIYLYLWSFIIDIDLSLPNGNFMLLSLDYLFKRICNLTFEVLLNFIGF